MCRVQDLASLQEAIATLGHRIEVRWFGPTSQLHVSNTGGACQEHSC